MELEKTQNGSRALECFNEEFQKVKLLTDDVHLVRKNDKFYYAKENTDERILHHPNIL